MAYFTIDDIQIASPCTAKWNDMAGDDFARHCAECSKNVYNLSLLTRAEANELIREKEGTLCVRFFRRFDGTVLTADCPVGLRTVRRQYLKARAKLIAAALAVWALVAGTSSCDGLLGPHELMGIPAVPDSMICHDSTTVQDTVHHN